MELSNNTGLVLCKQQLFILMTLLKYFCSEWLSVLKSTLQTVFGKQASGGVEALGGQEGLGALQGSYHYGQCLAAEHPPASARPCAGRGTGRLLGVLCRFHQRLGLHEKCGSPCHRQEGTEPPAPREAGMVWTSCPPAWGAKELDVTANTQDDSSLE